MPSPCSIRRYDGNNLYPRKFFVTGNLLSRISRTCNTQEQREKLWYLQWNGYHWILKSTSRRYTRDRSQKKSCPLNKNINAHSFDCYELFNVWIWRSDTFVRTVNILKHNESHWIFEGSEPKSNNLKTPSWETRRSALTLRRSKLKIGAAFNMT